MIASNQLVQNCNEPQRSFNDKKIHKDQFFMVDYLVFVWFHTCTHVSAEYLNYSCVFFIFTKLQSYARGEELYYCVIFYPFMIVIGRITVQLFDSQCF